jgi:[protein-PII] uridylyltransferase
MSKSLPPPPEVFADPPTVAQPGQELPWRERRDWFRARLQQQPLAGLGADEVEVHFSGLPPHYWEHVNESDLRWGLETVHGFLKAISLPNTPATAPFVNWRPESQSLCARVMLCTWDRHGLLAKAAAAFSAVRLNIIEAEVFTRADNVVLDLFRVAQADGRAGVNPTRLQEMTFLLEGALSEPPRFASVWACSRHKYLAPPARIPCRITFDNDSAGDATLVRVEASDRLGLLYDILQAMADSGLNITSAAVSQQNHGVG